jgi:hypothetical protein
VILSLVFLTGCITSRLKFIDQQVKYAKKNPELLKEMAEYAVMFCIRNKVNHFNAESISDKKIRQQMSRLGETVYVTFTNSCCFNDSSVTFHSVSITQGTQEFIYDFRVHPRNDGSEEYITKESATIQTSERIYYKKRPFPMM